MKLGLLRAVLFGLLLAGGAAQAHDAAVAVTVTEFALNTSSGIFAFGDQCTGSDCPAAHYHVTLNGTPIANASGICFREVVGKPPYMMDGSGAWSQWDPSQKTFVATAALSPACSALSLTPDGTAAAAVVTAAGTWSLGAACFGSFETLLNGQHMGAPGGCGNLYAVDHGGQVYTRDSGNNWWQWTGNWTNLGTTTQP